MSTNDKGLFAGNEIVLDYDVINDILHHKSTLITKVFGLPLEVAHAQHYLMRYGIVRPEYAEDFLNSFLRIQNGAPYSECLIRVRSSSGQLLWVQMMLTTIFEEEKPVRALGVLKDVTERQNAELKWSQHRDSLLKEAVLYYEANLTQQKVTFGTGDFFENSAKKNLEDYGDFITTLVHSTVYPDERAAVSNALSSSTLLKNFKTGKTLVEVEYRRLTGKGNVILTRGRAMLLKPIGSDDILAFFTAIDITGFKNQSLSLPGSAHLDPLTGLSNMVQAENRISECLTEKSSAKGISAMLVIGMNHLEAVTEQMGNYFRDALLSELGAKLKTLCRNDDVAGNNGGRQFILFLNYLPNAAVAISRAEHICRLFCGSQPDALNELHFSITVGISIAPDHGTAYKELYRRAHIALMSCDPVLNPVTVFNKNEDSLVLPSGIPVGIPNEPSAKPFAENISEYVFGILYEASDLNAGIEGVLELILKRFDLSRGFIYDITADGTAYRTYERRLSDMIPQTEAALFMDHDTVARCEKYFADNCLYFIENDNDFEEFGFPGDFSFRLVHCFKVNGKISGFIGFDRIGSPNCEFSEEDRKTLRSVSQVLDVYLASRTTSQNLLDSMLLLQSIVDGMDNCTYIIDPTTHVIKYMNQNAQKEFENAEPGTCCYTVLRGRNKPCDDCPIDRMMQENTKSDYSEMFLDHYKLWARIHASLVQVPSGQQFGIFSAFDFTEAPRQVLQQTGELSDFTFDTSLYDAMSLSTDDYIVMCDVSTNRYFFPTKMVEDFNLPRQVIVDAIPLWLSYIHEDDRDAFTNDLNQMFNGQTDTHNQEYRALNKDGAWVWIRAKGHMERNNDGKPTLFVIVLTNLGKKSKVDHLTGLLDKYEFEVSTRSALESGLKKGALLILALDNFKYINSAYGWEFGDHVLKETSTRLLSTLPEKLHLFRLDGDKFGVFFPNTELKEVEAYYQSLYRMFRHQKKYEDKSYYYTISAGCIYFENEEVSFETLFKKASHALDCAKHDGKNRMTIYDENTMSDNEYLLQMIAFLNKSVDNQFENFSLHYQPQIEPRTFRITSAEALLRWNHPTLGSISPVVFIPLLEKVGLIHKVGRFVIQQAAETCREWGMVCENFTISVNVSFVQLQDPDFIPYLKRLIKDGSLTPQMLHLEITESCIADGSRSVGSVIEDLREIGFIIEMDDFGTGYSSLEILKNAPADVVKIDHAFVKDITHSNFDATFIRFVVALCHSVNIRVCLEGVETYEEYKLVKEMDLDLIQGYLFGRPNTKDIFKKNHLVGSTETPKPIPGE